MTTASGIDMPQIAVTPEKMLFTETIKQYHDSWTFTFKPLGYACIISLTPHCIHQIVDWAIANGVITVIGKLTYKDNGKRRNYYGKPTPEKTT